MTSDIKKTALYDRHIELGAKLVEFGGWYMPVSYPEGIIAEHLTTRKYAGLFDVSHMGRFIIRGADRLTFLQHILTSNVEALNCGDMSAQYTIIANENGGAIDDAYVYRFTDNEYLLVVNAANRIKDWKHCQQQARQFKNLELIDKTEEISMFALQGPRSRDIISQCLETGKMPEPVRNATSQIKLGDIDVNISRTGYTGEPLCFELFVEQPNSLELWNLLLDNGAKPIGLGARDTLRLEAGLPLYGHEFGADADNNEIPIMSCPLARFAVSFSPLKGNFLGQQQLILQNQALQKIMVRDYSLREALPRISRTIALSGRGVPRQGSKVYKDDKHIGYISSGTMIPYWVYEGEGLLTKITEQHGLRSIAIAYIDCDILDDEKIFIDIRGKKVEALVVPYHLRSLAPPYARPIIYDHELEVSELPSQEIPKMVRYLLKKTLENTNWRQQQCINLIPSEMSISPMSRLVSIMDPCFRYAEHKPSPDFYDANIFYYQGCGFIDEVEQLLEIEMKKFLGCEEVESRLISGQMANTTVFSAMVDYINRTDRKSEPRRIRQVMNNHIGKGGHLSSQPMGALRDYVRRNPQTESPAVVNFPVCDDNPYKINVPATLELIDQYRPELIILGKSMVLHREPVADIRRFLDEQGINAVVLYDMAHVLGLTGPYFQEPFAEGADLVTGSTHKTFFGTQRGIIGSRLQEGEERYQLWQAVNRRAFPGAVSNHHLGTLLGLLMASYEMNYFKDDYQKKVLSNAKHFAKALKAQGLDIAGDPSIDYTETHQVIVNTGYSKGPEIAQRLEENNIICNYQACPDEESFTSSGALRLGVSEMTRFGMGPDDFTILAGLIHDVVKNDQQVKSEVQKFRQQFLTMEYCFKKEDYAEVMEKLYSFL